MSETRKLAAILAADVVGYSRLMGEDEAGTARVVRERREAAAPIVRAFGGRLVKTTGDGALLEFPSVVAAVECAILIQKMMAERNAALPDAKRILYRIGVNLGDVLIEGDDILGDGVNIAARLEGIAEPGGICISEDAFHQHVAEMDADAPFRAAIGGSGCVALRRQLLQPDRALNSVDHRAELDQHAIAGGLDDTTAMVCDERICRGAVVAQCLRRARLVEPHQAAVACHISGKDRGELADCGHSSGIPALRRPAKYVASYRARIFGTPCHMRAFRCAMLEKRSLPFSLRASASSATARSISPLRA